MITLSYAATFVAGAVFGAVMAWVVANKINDYIFRMMARQLGNDIRSGELSLDKIAGGHVKRGQAVYFDSQGKVHVSPSSKAD